MIRPPLHPRHVSTSAMCLPQSRVRKVCRVLQGGQRIRCSLVWFGIGLEAGHRGKVIQATTLANSPTSNNILVLDTDQD